jgi:hypothetical protein
LGKLNSKERPDARYLVIALPDLRHHIHSYRAFSGTSGHIPVFKLIFIFFFAGPCEEQGSAPFQASPCACLLDTRLGDNPSHPPPPTRADGPGRRARCARADRRAPGTCAARAGSAARPRGDGAARGGRGGRGGRAQRCAAQGARVHGARCSDVPIPCFADYNANDAVSITCLIGCFWYPWTARRGLRMPLESPSGFFHLLISRR